MPSDSKTIRPDLLALISLGAAAGSIARYQFSDLQDHNADLSNGFLAVVIACLVTGILLGAGGRSPAVPGADSRLQCAALGLSGGFAGVSLFAVVGASATRVWAGVAYFVLTPAVAICALITGVVFARWTSKLLVPR